MFFPGTHSRDAVFLSKHQQEAEVLRPGKSPPKMPKMMGSTAGPRGRVDHGETQPATLVQMTLIKAAVLTSPSRQLTVGDTVPQEVQGPSSSASPESSPGTEQRQEKSNEGSSHLTPTQPCPNLMMQVSRSLKTSMRVPPGGHGLQSTNKIILALSIFQT